MKGFLISFEVRGLIELQENVTGYGMHMGQCELWLLIGDYQLEGNMVQYKERNVNYES